MEQYRQTCENILNHYKKYPKMCLQDLFKFLFQSAFGCEHMVSSLDNAIDYINDEYITVDKKATPLIEELDGNYCRVHLSCLNSGVTAETLGKLFFLSAKREDNGQKELIVKLKVLNELIVNKQLPFDVEDFERQLKTWQAEGYKAVHHSKQFKENYNPNYRLISKQFVPFLLLFAELDKKLQNKNLIIAIEGGSGSGKTTLSQILNSVYDCAVVHTDDFFLQSHQRIKERYNEAGGNLDRERLIEEVLQPLKENKKIVYHKFDCSTMQLGEQITFTPKKLTVVEGAYSMHPDLMKYYDFSVFLDISKESQKTRIINRNGETFAQNFFNLWIPLEEKYFSLLNIKENCNMKITIK